MSTHPPLPDTDATASPLAAPRPDEAPAAPPAPEACRNCGEPLLGPHCYACGQPVKGEVRHFSTVMGDIGDTLFNVDSRIVRTVLPLFARPGFLSREFFAGRRVRYVTPFRLFFVTAVLAFLVAQWSLDIGDEAIRFEQPVQQNGFDDDTTREAVEARLATAVAGLEEARREAAQVPFGSAALGGLEAAEATVRRAAEQRIAEIEAQAGAPAAEAAPGEAAPAAAGEAPAAADPAAPPPDARRVSDAYKAGHAVGRAAAGDLGDTPSLQFNGRDWHPETNPIEVAWLPAFGNDLLNRAAGRAQSRLERAREHPAELVEAFIGVLPQTLFVLMPLFALMLKVTYVFKRRLYMEHLIVALHSHAFLCLALLLQLLLADVRGLLADGGVLDGLLGWAAVALWVWMPLYLLLMQKRVYGQGWIMTLLKYAMLGFAYLFLISFGATAAALASLVV